MITIAHFSDLHYSEKNLVEADRCFGFAVDEAIRRGAQVAVISGDATDHALDMHSPAVQCLARHVRRLADHCLVLMLQGTYSHEPPGTLSILRLLGGRYPVHVADCRRRFKSEPPRRPNIEPGVEADFEMGRLWISVGPCLVCSPP
jgi:DNA repair protein SbcD/Mre11